MSEFDKPSRRQIVMNWLMRDDTTAKDGWWGGSEAVAYVDELLAALDAASPSASAPQYTVQVGDGPPMPITKEAFEGIFGKAALSHEGTNNEAGAQVHRADARTTSGTASDDPVTTGEPAVNDRSCPASPSTARPSGPKQGETPRTDAEAQKTEGDYYLGGYVDSEFSRQLERELAVYTGASSNKTDWCPCCKQGWGVAKKLVALQSSTETQCLHFKEFWEKHALGSKLCPSCLLCGQQRPREQWAIQHGELPDIYICEPCVTAARSASGKHTELLQRIHDDLKIRASFSEEGGVVDLSSGIWRDLLAALATPDGRSQT